MSLKKEKFRVSHYNPSKRKNEVLELEEMQVGVLKYVDESDNFKCLVGVETELVGGAICNNKGVSIRQPRRISRLTWGVSSGENHVGDRVSLCPRDIAVLDTVIQYLKKKGYYIP